MPITWYRPYCMAHITCIVWFSFLQHRFGALWSEHLLHKIESCNEVCLNKCSCDCSVETVIPCETPTDDKPCGQKGNPGIKGPAGSDGSKGCTGAKEFDSIRFLSYLTRLTDLSILINCYGTVLISIIRELKKHFSKFSLPNCPFIGHSAVEYSQNINKRLHIISIKVGSH